MIRTPDGFIDVTAVQKRAAEQLKECFVTNEIKMVVGLLATLIEELESRDQQLTSLRETMTY